jgi:DNA-binding transcriptional LysR family regulator
MLNVDLLRVFIAVAESGGFTRAASVLHRSQSAVSMQIKRLEEILGVSVFDRNGTSIQLNAEGEIFIGYARRILRLVDESISKVNAKKRITSIRLGCIEDYAARVLPRILAEFWSEHPDVQIEVSTGETPELLARLGSDYDLVLAMHPCGSGEGRVVCVDALTWVASKMQSPHETEPLPVALRPEGCMEREWAILALESAGRPWRCAYVSAGIGTLQTAVEQGLAVGVFKEATITGDLRRLGRAESFPQLPEVEIALHMADDGISAPAVNLLVEKLTSGLRKPDWPTP